MAKTKTKKVTKGGKLYTVTSTDGGKTWTNPKLYSTPKKTKTNSSTSTPMRGKGASSEQVAKALKSDNKTVKQKLQDWWKPGSSGKNSSKKTTGTGRKSIEASNRKIHGDKKIDALKIKHSEWKKARKEGTMDEWNKKYKKKKSKFSSSWD